MKGIRVLIMGVALLALYAVVMRLNIGIVQASSLTDEEKSKIDRYIENAMSEVDFPGIVISVVKGSETLLVKGYGYSDIGNKKKMSPNTLFEIGSNSKAFTGLGLLILEEKGMLSLDDPVKKYLPWFSLKFKGKEYEVKLSHLLYHTSGLSPNSINNVLPMQDDNALERTVRDIMKYKAISEPGVRFTYSTVNYDIIGLVIEKVSGKKYEKFMMEDVLQPLGLTKAVVGRENSMLDDNISIGYKYGLMGNKAYNAPVYRGNTPAGYISVNGIDMARWLKIQLQTEVVDGFPTSIIERSQKPDRSVPSNIVYPYDKPFSYAAGWLAFDGVNGLLSHGGNNPNYSSYVIISHEEKIGIAVMGNRNSSYTFGIARAIYSILRGDEPLPPPTDIPYLVGKLSLIIVILALLLAVYGGIRLVLLIRNIRNGIMIKALNGKKSKLSAIIWLGISLLAGFVSYFFPSLLLGGYIPWSFVSVWYPDGIWIVAIAFFGGVSVFSTYRIIKVFYCKEKPLQG